MVFAVFLEPPGSPWVYKTDQNGFLNGVSDKMYTFFRRQDLPPVYMPNGAIYVIYVKDFRECNSFLTARTLDYSMSNSQSIDVDSVIDLEACREQILNNI